LKRNLQEKRNSSAELELFISNYVFELIEYFKSFKELLVKVDTDPRYYKIFSILQVSATLYPLVIKLNRLSKLDEKININNTNIDYLDIIELIDVRIYKTRGDFKADICRFTCDFDKEIYANAHWLFWFNGAKMSKEQLRYCFNSRVYGIISALDYIFFCYNEKLNGRLFTIEELKGIMKTEPTIEHILSQTPNYDPTVFGFDNEEDYFEYAHKIGNLSLLERKLQSVASNKVPFDKTKVYDRSMYPVSHEVSVFILNKKGFTKQEIMERTEKFLTYVVDRWWCDVNSIKDNNNYRISDDNEEIN
jgi:hypothetical protein